MAHIANTATRARLDLPDGSALEFEIRPSNKARTLRLKVSARRGLVVTVPHGLESARLMQLVASKADWIAGRLAAFDALRHLVGNESPARPQAIDLPALAESWRVEYKETRSQTVGALSGQPGRLVVSGAIEDVASCHAALRRWLARRAKQALTPWLLALSRDTGLRHSDVTVKTQRTRWGSCSANGRISLNCKLLFLSRESVRYVLVHELCHTQEMNHTTRFWALLRRHEAATERLHAGMRDAWKQVPAWASPVWIGERGF